MESVPGRELILQMQSLIIFGMLSELLNSVKLTENRTSKLHAEQELQIRIIRCISLFIVQLD